MLAQGEHIVPIPGARREQHLRENVAAAEIRLSAADLAEIAASQDPGKVQGERYTAASLALVNR